MEKKLLALILATSMALAFTACGSSSNDSETKKTTSEIAEEKKEESQTKPTEEQAIKVPGLKGSQAYDIILSLEETGVPKAEAVATSDGFQFDSMNDSYSYSITTNSNHEVMCATFMVLTETDSEGYLSFCASMPYDAAESEKARSWVESNLGQDATTEFGKATFTLSNGNQGPILTVKDTEYDSYVLSTLEK